MLIDTHAHLDFKEFDKDREEVIKRAESSGVEKIINIGCNLERAKKSIKLAAKYENVYATVGIHPHDVKKYDLYEAKGRLIDLARQKGIVAIGECGLDYFRIEGEKEKVKSVQKEFFKMQLGLAQKLNLPIVIHCRDAFQDLLNILKIYSSKLAAKGVTHCFSGSLKYAQEFLTLGFMLSFTGSITYVKPGSDLLKVIKEVSLDKIMIETDSPYLAPVPHRGERNEPAYVKFVAEKVAFVKEIGLDEVAEKTSKNAVKLFKLS